MPVDESPPEPTNSKGEKIMTMRTSEKVFNYICQQIDEADTYAKLINAGRLIEEYWWVLDEGDEEILWFNYSLAYNDKAEKLFFQMQNK